MSRLPSISLIILIIIFGSCSSDDQNLHPGSTTVNLRYEFSADVSDSFIIAYSIDTIIPVHNVALTIDDSQWVKDTTVAKSNVTRVARCVAYAPLSWAGTTLQTNATLKIFVDGQKKDSVTNILSGFDRPTGITASASY
jgi:hypothetical protein